jgi:tRNA(Ile)-lysidine synthase
VQVTGDPLFDATLDRLAPEGRVGLAVSGGPDSLALLLLAARARPSDIEVATVDHGLRPESAAEAAKVADICDRLGVPHFTLQAEVADGASRQARSREARYDVLGLWMMARRLPWLATAHHADDQAETLLMRLARGSGLSGLSAIRERLPISPDLTIIRPLLDWSKAELRAVVEQAGIDPVDDPSNRDPAHDRTRFRSLLAAHDWIDPARLARSAAALAEAEEALDFAIRPLEQERLWVTASGVSLHAFDLPAELQRRLLARAFRRLGPGRPRGPELDRALDCLRGGGRCTLAGALLTGGEVWKLSPEPPRA